MKAKEKTEAKLFIREQCLARASQPLGVWEIGSKWKVVRTKSGPQKVGPRMVEIHVDGVLLWTWPEDNMPGLGAWIEDRLAQLRGLQYFAAGPIKALPTQIQSAADTAKAKTGRGEKYLLVLTEIERLRAKDFDPYKSMPAIAKRAGCSVPYVRKILNGE